MIESAVGHTTSRWKSFGAILFESLANEIEIALKNENKIEQLWSHETTLVGLVATGLSRNPRFSTSTVKLESTIKKPGGTKTTEMGRADLILERMPSEEFDDCFGLWIEAKRSRSILKKKSQLSATWFGSDGNLNSIRDSLISQARRDYLRSSDNMHRVRCNTVEGYHYGALLFALLDDDSASELDVIEVLKTGFSLPRLNVATSRTMEEGSIKGMRIRRRPTVVAAFRLGKEKTGPMLVASFTIFSELSTSPPDNEES
ncbi:hypothetical protein GCM10027046_13380 [Uliginosibacterium flavum]|uniref:Restriction endonuclease n=1 Tax=Uliginosibacterium flavum TaxID=1396831 RepID=A0ABV2TQ16_9RHOO